MPSAAHDSASPSSWIPALCAVATAAVVSSTVPAHAESPSEASPDEAPGSEQPSFQDWVKSSGGDAAAVYIAKSKVQHLAPGHPPQLLQPAGNSARTSTQATILLQDPYAGNALFADPEKRPGTKLGKRLMRLRRLLSTSNPLASFPLSLAFTMETAMQDPLLGGNYQELYELGVAGERQIVMLMLMIEKLRGPDSKWAPYIQQLPTK